MEEEDCKKICAEDPRCKGYYTKEGYNNKYECHVSTDADCPKGASWLGPFAEENIGDIRKKVECINDTVNDTSVCHIKQSGKSTPY